MAQNHLPPEHSRKDRTVDLLSMSAVWIIAVALAYSAAIDLYIYTTRSNALTVSDHIFMLLSDYPIIGVAGGIVVGHLSWGPRPTISRPPS